MLKNLSSALALLSALAVALTSFNGNAVEPFVIGELGPYARLPAYSMPFRNGADLAVAEIDRESGFAGREIRIISRDEGNDSQTALQAAADLIHRDKAKAVIGGFDNDIAIALAKYFNENQVTFLAGGVITSQLPRQNKPNFTYQLRPNATDHARIMIDYVGKNLGRRWAYIGANSEYGLSILSAFQQVLSHRKIKVQWVGEEWVSSAAQAGSLGRAVHATQPEVLLVGLYGADLAAFVADGTARKLFERRKVLVPFGGDPEWLEPIGGMMPENWVLSGYPADQVKIPNHAIFREAYIKRFGQSPRYASLLGYLSVKFVVEAAKHGNPQRPPEIAAAVEDIKLNTPLGNLNFRRESGQSTLGVFVGHSSHANAATVLKDWLYVTTVDQFAKPNSKQP